MKRLEFQRLATTCAIVGGNAVFMLVNACPTCLPNTTKALNASETILKLLDCVVEPKDVLLFRHLLRISMARRRK